MKHSLTYRLNERFVAAFHPVTHAKAAEFGWKTTRKCCANDLISTSLGLQCGNCGSFTSDHGATWNPPPPPNTSKGTKA